MADSSEGARIARQVQAHLESLREAGVEWLPQAAEPLTVAAAEPASSSESAETAPAAAPASGPSLADRRQALTLLAQEIAPCRLCGELASTRTQTVFGDGQAGVELCFVGEAPGADEDAQGLPFVGAAGQLLNKIIAA